MALKLCTTFNVMRKGALLFFEFIYQISSSHRPKNRKFESNFSKIIRPVSAIKSLRFVLSPSGTHFNEIRIESQTCQCKKMNFTIECNVCFHIIHILSATHSISMMLSDDFISSPTHRWLDKSKNGHYDIYLLSNLILGHIVLHCGYKLTMMWCDIIPMADLVSSSHWYTFEDRLTIDCIRRVSVTWWGWRITRMVGQVVATRWHTLLDYAWEYIKTKQYMTTYDGYLICMLMSSIQPKNWYVLRFINKNMTNRGWDNYHSNNREMPLTSDRLIMKLFRKQAHL